MSWFGSLVSMELRKGLSYRLDFWGNFLAGTVVELLVAWAVWKAVFASAGAETVGGYTFPGMMLYALLARIFGTLVRGVDYGYIAGDIYSGGLNRALLYPVPALAPKLALHLATAVGCLLQAAVALGAYALVMGRIGGFPPELAPDPARALAAVGLAVVASLFHFVLVIALELVSFWADNTWSLLVLNRFVVQLLGGALVPLTLYPGWAQDALAWTPFPALVSTPIRVFLGQANLAECAWSLGTLAVWGLGLLALTRTVWRRGLRQYAGVGI